MTRRRHAGFTLLELLVAIALFAVVAALAYGGLDMLGRSARQIEETAERLAAVQRAMDMLARDLRQATARGVRDGDGRPLPALVGTAQQLELTRAGYANTLAQPRAELERVGWRRAGEAMQRLHHRVLDRAGGGEPRVDGLLDGVQSLEWRFLGQDGREHSSWPPPRGAQVLPRAVELRIVLEDLGALRRVVELAGPAQ